MSVIYKDNNWIDLTNVPYLQKGDSGYRKDTPRKNWKKCLNTEVSFYYKGKKGLFYVTYHMEDKGKVKVEYDNYVKVIDPHDLKTLNINKIVNPPNKAKYREQEVVNGDTVRTIIKVKNVGIVYTMICSEYKEEYDIRESDLLRGRGSPYKSGRKVCYTNSLYSVENLREYICDLEYSKTVTKFSHKDVKCKCPICGEVKIMKVNKLVNNGFSCHRCSSTITYPERLMIGLLELNNLNYEYQKVFKDLPNRKFDFYLPKLNMVIETHGLQHYRELNGYMNHEKTKESDLEKYNYCKNKNIDYIEINCSYSDLSFILNNVENSKLNNILKNKDYHNLRNYIIRSKNDDIKYSIYLDYCNGLSKKELKDKYNKTSYYINRSIEIFKH